MQVKIASDTVDFGYWRILSRNGGSLAHWVIFPFSGGFCQGGGKRAKTLRSNRLLLDYTPTASFSGTRIKDGLYIFW